ncbi:MAG TPA: hypothetical protein VIW69_12595 [Candidatus Elarobacter sp.]
MTPQYEPQQIAAVNAHDILQRQQPATPATWAVGIMLVIAAIAWIVLVAVHLRS